MSPCVQSPPSETAQVLRLRRLPGVDYKTVFADRRRFFGKMLTLWVSSHANADRRVGVVVSRQALRRAVDRNRAKRLMRETFRHCWQHLDNTVDVILVAHVGIHEKSYQEVMAEFEYVCKRAKIWVR